MSFRQQAEDLHAAAMAKIAMGHEHAGRDDLRTIRQLFAAEHGWKERKYFDGFALAAAKQSVYRYQPDSLPNLDHTYYFKLRRVPMAIVTFPYNNSDQAWAEMRAVADRRGLTVELLDWPNWYSDHYNATTGIIWRRKI